MNVYKVILNQIAKVSVKVTASHPYEAQEKAEESSAWDQEVEEIVEQSTEEVQLLDEADLEEEFYEEI